MDGVAMNYDIGAKVVINKCDACPAVVGKTATITGFTNDPGYAAVELNFGRGRPQTSRPKVISLDDVRLVKVHVLGDEESPATQEEVNEYVDSLQKE